MRPITLWELVLPPALIFIHYPGNWSVWLAGRSVCSLVLPSRSLLDEGAVWKEVSHEGTLYMIGGGSDGQGEKHIYRISLYLWVDVCVYVHECVFCVCVCVS